MADLKPLPPKISRGAQIYLAAVIVCGITAIAFSLFQLYLQPLGYHWYLLAALTLISGSATVQLPSVPASISISETFVIASALLFGPAAGTVTVALDGLVISFWMAKRRPEWYRALFNMAAPSVSIWTASHLLFSIGGIQPLIHQSATLNALFVPLVLFAFVYFGFNSWLIAGVVALETKKSAYRIWRENFLWLSLNYFSGASVALLLVVYTRDVDLRFVGVIVPLLLVLYFTFKTAMQRVEDTNRHLEELNRLHLSTIETLAMAIDAKDQITHGHIRRVQTLAVRLANRVGITDETLIRAIEAAALLHDMGKLAIPEYILNKPGKLTPAEFERMKSHAAAGADILSSIDFPYPVTPIVRHHHENWDGSGYPDGLHGIDIPVGARILAVVDCFDALTSDRPYRPRLSQDDALGILIQRRGTMYDPLIVDTFTIVYKEIAPVVALADRDLLLNNIMGASTASSTDAAGDDDIASGADEMLTLYELASSLAGQADVFDTGDVIAKHLNRLIPFSSCVLYLYDDQTFDLEAKHVMGDLPSNVRGLRIPLGQRLSGWVGANRKSILNSDPRLDFGDLARNSQSELRSCLSSALVCEDDLVGVLSLYSDIAEHFTENHRRLLEGVTNLLAHTFQRAVEFTSAAHRDPLTGLPNLLQLEHLLETVGGQSLITANATLLIIDIPQLLQSDSADLERNEGLHAIVKRIRAELNVGDILFRHEQGQLVALLNNSGTDAAALIKRRIADALFACVPVAAHSHDASELELIVTAIPIPSRARDLHDALNGRQTTTNTECASSPDPRVH
ncbi:MAG TPA: HD domain-containing phosphohydrolase [Fimbriimonas sp.]|nr:HD domain-containing phosphohydrolase [Fimbriimonas sp.]